MFVILRQNCTKVLDAASYGNYFPVFNPEEIVKSLFPVHFSFISSVVGAFGSI